MNPYYTDTAVQLFLGDCREVLPQLLERPVSCVTDVPYGETSAAWDRWPDGWVDAVGAVLPPSVSLWCFGTERVWLDHGLEFRAGGWKFAQSQLWIKHNGTGPTSRDRLVKIHEWAYHWYRGRWGDLHHEWERDKSLVDKGHVRSGNNNRAKHRHGYQAKAYDDDGTRQPRSVTYLIETPSVRYQKRHQDEKPLPVVVPLVRECTPPGGLVLDCFAGSGTTGVAAKMIGRRALLIEGDEAMCEKAALRLDGRQGDLLELLAEDAAVPS